MKRKAIILMGTNDWVIPVFERAANEHDIVAVFTRGPKPAGRKRIVTKSPVHVWAESRGIPVYNRVKEFSSLKPQISNLDYIVVASYGVILKDDVLNFAPCVNIHPSDLPKYRGPAPMSTAVYNGDTESAVCLMRVAAEVDAGGVYMRAPFAIGENDTTADVESRVGAISAEMLSGFLASPSNYPSAAQVGTPTFTRKWTPDDEIINWNRGAEAIHNQVRSIGGRTKINGLDVKILETRVNNDEFPFAKASGGRLEILRVQPAGKNPMDWKSFVNGFRGARIEFGK
ncbi:MAG: methionyl-tRNA formyltransferase [Alphaproteobacteria bacterium]|nr:methionyl-tRNA formyltransferase [Alphaproteobacteria bacterium]MCL2757893.1 methionyl-tRNA formyltransferase [Alphaproteobacteria bacterium]